MLSSMGGPPNLDIYYYYRHQLKARYGMSATDENEAREMLDTLQRAQLSQQHMQQQASQQLTAEHIRQQIYQGSPPPSIRRPATQPRRHYTALSPVSTIGEKLVNKLMVGLPLKMALVVQSAVFFTTERIDGMHTEPRIEVTFHGGKIITIPIDDEDKFMGDGDGTDGQWSRDAVIARLAIEAP